MTLIEDLYKASSTPAAINYINNPEIEEMVDYFLSSHSRLLSTLQFNQNEVKEVIQLMLSVAETPQSLRGLLLIEPCVRYLLLSSCIEIGMSLKDIVKFGRLEKAWYTTLKKESPHAKEYMRKPDITESPLFRYHVDALGSSTVDDRTLSPLYKAHGFLIHKAIRFNLSLKIDEKTKETYARRGRYYFKYMPTEIKIQRKHLKQITPDYINAFAHGYDEMELARYDVNLSETAQGFKEDFERLISFSIIKPKNMSEGHGAYRRPRGNHEKDILRKQPSVGRATVLDPDGHIPDVNARYVKPPVAPTEDNEEKLVNIFETVPEIPIYEIPGADMTKKPSIKKKFADLINLRAFNFFFDINYLNLFHYSILYLRLVKLWNLSAFQNAVIVYLYILMNTGIDHVLLLHLSTRSREGRPMLRKVNGKYYILIPSIIKKPDIKIDDCLPTSDVVWVPLPEPIGRLIPEIQNESEYLFSYKTTDGVKRINVEDIIIFLDEEVKDSYQICDLKITPAKICSSFLANFHHRLGLDPLICVLICGEDRHRLYKSPLHYVYIPHQLLEEKYLETFKLSTASLVRNINTLFSEGFLDEETTTIEYLFPVVDLAKIDTTDDDRMSLSFGYGSSIICTDDHIHDIVMKLKRTIEQEKNPLIRHNYFIVYAYLSTEFSCGMRPRNNPDILFNENANSIAIHDKQSAKFHEERILSTTGILSHILRQLKSGVHLLKKYIAKYYGPSILLEFLDDLYFFIDPQTGQPIKFSLSGMRQICDMLDISSTLPMNFPRHFLKNHMYHTGISNNVIDMRMGHQHAGKEMLNATSSTSPRDANGICQELINEMLGRLGFGEIDYWQG